MSGNGLKFFKYSSIHEIAENLVTDTVAKPIDPNHLFEIDLDGIGGDEDGESTPNMMQKRGKKSYILRIEAGGKVFYDARLDRFQSERAAESLERSLDFFADELWTDEALVDFYDEHLGKEIDADVAGKLWPGSEARDSVEDFTDPDVIRDEFADYDDDDDSFRDVLVDEVFPEWKKIVFGLEIPKIEKDSSVDFVPAKVLQLDALKNFLDGVGVDGTPQVEFCFSYFFLRTARSFVYIIWAQLVVCLCRGHILL